MSVGSLDVAAFITTLSCSITAMKELYESDMRVDHRKLVIVAYLPHMAITLIFGLGIVLESPLIHAKILVEVALIASGLFLLSYLWFCMADLLNTFEAEAPSTSNVLPASDDLASLSILSM